MGGGITLREKVILGLLVALLAAGALWRGLEKPAPAAMERVEGGFERDLGQAVEREPEMLVVHLVGAVNSPGVYRLAVGSRVVDLLEAAGGYSEDADLAGVNLARPLFDGEQMVIPRIGEPPSSPQQSSASGKININKASAEELTALPNIGAVRAARIVEHREKYGPFKNITEIMDVSGIGQGIFNSIEELITIY